MTVSIVPSYFLLTLKVILCSTKIIRIICKLFYEITSVTFYYKLQYMVYYNTYCRYFCRAFAIELRPIVYFACMDMFTQDDGFALALSLSLFLNTNISYIDEYRAKPRAHSHSIY